MAGADGERDYSWIETVKSGGPVPYLEPENCSNGWATPPGDSFMVRGPSYLSDKVKIPAGEYLLKPLGFDWIKGPAKICDLLSNSNHRVRRAIDDETASGNNPFVWAFNLQLPSKDNYSAVAYFVALDPIQDGSLVDKFLKGEDTFRNSRLKLIANIVKGPWIVRTAVGEQAICILGRALSCKYISGLNYMEVDVDIGSSMVANAIVHVAFGYVKTITVDLAFLIESQTQEELPEQILGAIRFSDLNPDSAGLYELSSEEDSGNLQSSLPTRFWKSIGLGLPQLLHLGRQDSSAPMSDHANGSLHGEEGEENNGIHGEDGEKMSDHANGSLHGKEGEKNYGSLNGEEGEKKIADHANGSLHGEEGEENNGIHGEGGEENNGIHGEDDEKNNGIHGEDDEKNNGSSHGEDGEKKTSDHANVSLHGKEGEKNYGSLHGEEGEKKMSDHANGSLHENW